MKQKASHQNKLCRFECDQFGLRSAAFRARLTAIATKRSAMHAVTVLRPASVAARPGRSPVSTSQPGCRLAPAAGLGSTRWIARAYDVEVEPTPTTPSSGPGRWSAPPPPPPPPPPPQGGPSRREALFAFMGTLIGGVGVAVYYNTQYDMSTDAAEAALDQILDDPDFLNAVAEEALFKEFSDDLDAADKDIDTEFELEKNIEELTKQLEEMTKEVDTTNAAVEAELAE